MTTTNIPPPRKLTESEDIASFNDWWFQLEHYYSKDEYFHEFFNNPDFTWQSKSAPCCGLKSEQKAAYCNNHLNHFQPGSCLDSLTLILFINCVWCVFFTPPFNLVNAWHRLHNRLCVHHASIVYPMRDIILLDLHIIFTLSLHW